MISVINHLILKFMRWFFNHLYHGCASSYDFVSSLVSFGRWQEWVKTAIAQMKGNHVLELGFGPGHLLQALAEEGYCVFGVDESRQMCRIAQRRVKKLAASEGGIQIMRGRAEALPFADGSMDCIVATFPSEYILHPDTLTGCKRVLAAEGRVVILAGVAIGGKSWYKRLLRRIYLVTHQSVQDISPRMAWLKPLETAGFKTGVVRQQFKDDELILIILTKAETPFSGNENQVQ